MCWTVDVHAAFFLSFFLSFLFFKWQLCQGFLQHWHSEVCVCVWGGGWQRGFVNYTAVSGGLEVFLFVPSRPVSLSVGRARVLCGDNTVRAAPSLLLLFMQQPGAVAGCAKDPGVQQTCPQNRSGGAVLLSFQRHGASCELRVSELCFPGWGGCSSRGFGADGAAFVASVLSLHEQRTGWSSRLGTERRWRSRRAVYNNNTIAVTSRDWQRARPVAEPRRHQQHAIFGKRLHHRGARAAGGGRDFRFGFSICSPETGQWVHSACLRSFKSGFFSSSFFWNELIIISQCPYSRLPVRCAFSTASERVITAQAWSGSL